MPSLGYQKKISLSVFFFFCDFITSIDERQFWVVTHVTVFGDQRSLSSSGPLEDPNGIKKAA